MNTRYSAKLPDIPAWPYAYRFLVIIFVLTTTVGFIIGLSFIEKTTHLLPAGIVTHYKGNKSSELQTGEELKFEKSVNEMLTTTHNHVLGLSFLFLIFGFLYLHTGRITFSKKIIAIEPLVSLVVTFGSLWLVRFVHPIFVYLVVLSGVLMAACFLWMAWIITRSCLRKTI